MTSGFKVTMDAQNMPRFGSITPYNALGTLSYVLSLDCVDWTMVRRRKTEMMHALLMSAAMRLLLGRLCEGEDNGHSAKRQGDKNPEPLYPGKG